MSSTSTKQSKHRYVEPKKTENRFPYEWTLKDAIFTKDKGKVFSCFPCGGGSTMGYKLAGFDVLGGNEIDPRVAACYVKNHHPKFMFVEPIQEFKLRERQKGKKKIDWSTDKHTMPEELFHLDILDGSPPCSSFSMAGNRDDDWGKEKVFKEGQAKQVLDTLFFDFIDLAKKLKPKVVSAENVKGLLLGKARAYVQRIYDEFDKAGYYVIHHLLDASKMGVPQRRERVFFLALRKDIAKPVLDYIDMFTMKPRMILKFNEKEIKFGEVRSEVGIDGSHMERAKILELREKSDKSIGDINQRLNKKTSGFNAMIRHDHEVCGTITSGEYDWRYCDGRMCTDMDYILCGTFPTDYDFLDQQVKYLVGMSVPPVMVAQVATQIHEQWLSKI